MLGELEMAWLVGFVVSERYKESGKNKAPRDYILAFPGIGDRDSAKLLVGSPVEYREGDLRIRGRVVAAHGMRGEVRARVVKGLPGLNGSGRVYLMLRPELAERLRLETSSQTV